MDRRTGIGLLVVGFLGAAYFGWAQYRADLRTVCRDGQWPRAWPYPDPWIAEWDHLLDVRNPVKNPDTIKLHGEFAAVRAVLACFFLGFLLIGGAGLRTLAIARVIENSPHRPELTDPNAVSTVEYKGRRLGVIEKPAEPGHK